MKRIRRMLAAWNASQPTTIVVNVPFDPAKTGKEIHEALVRYKRQRGGGSLGLD